MNRRSFLQTAAASVAATTAFGEASAKPPVRYPDPAIEVIDKDRFKSSKLAAVETLYTGTRWGEGPVWFGDGRYLIWSDIPNNKLMRWDEETGNVSVFRHNSNNTNGNSRDLQGRLISAEIRRVTRTEYDGSITVLADKYDGKQLIGPNDLVAHSDGHIWFTDPGYGTMGLYQGIIAEHELPGTVYRLNPDSGDIQAVAFVEKPNGLCFSPDHKTLYVSDTGASHKKGHPRTILSYDVVDGKTLTNEKVFRKMAPGGSDGIKCDIHGNVWSSAAWAGEGFDGVHVFAPDGDVIGKIFLPEVCANLCFGGPKLNRVFMASSQSLYSLFIETSGAQVW